MMRLRYLAAAMAATCTASFSAQADEGMWMPSQLPAIAAQLKQAGYMGDPAELADLTPHPLYAVLSLGGCTAIFLSPNRLVGTKHITYDGPTLTHSNTHFQTIAHRPP